jgi:hypothetical protein
MVATLALLVGTVRAAPAAVPGTATPLQAVITLVRPFLSPGPGTNACNALTGRIRSCPISARLRYRLQHYQRGENGNLVCRCQNPPRALHWTQTDTNGFVAHVSTRWLYGASSAYTITFVVGREEDGWRVDDAYCGGRPQTSVYNPPTGPCA